MDQLMATIILFAGNFTPKGWADCDGSLLEIPEYQALYALLGTTYGGDGETTFALPDLRGRVALGIGQGPDLTGRALGAAGGAEQVVLTTDNLPAHNHEATSTLRAAATPAVTALPAGNYLAQPNDTSLYAGSFDLTALGMQSVVTTTANTGQGQPVASMMPYLGLRYIIATMGLYPAPNSAS
jgi:microcystin-dependent protein